MIMGGFANFLVSTDVGCRDGRGEVNYGGD